MIEPYSNSLFAREQSISDSRFASAVHIGNESLPPAPSNAHAGNKMISFHSNPQLSFKPCKISIAVCLSK
jgi:hypothetical protein